MLAPQSELGPKDVAVVREVYDGDDSEDIFRAELERALEVGCRTIVIEPASLGERTSRWMAAGAGVRRAALTCGLATFAVGELCVMLYSTYLHHVDLMNFRFVLERASAIPAASGLYRGLPGRPAPPQLAERPLLPLPSGATARQGTADPEAPLRHFAGLRVAPLPFSGGPGAKVGWRVRSQGRGRRLRRAGRRSPSLRRDQGLERRLGLT